MRSLFGKIATVLVIGLILLGIVGKPQIHKMATEIDLGPANIIRR